MDGVIENRSLYAAERGSDKRISLTDDEQSGVSVVCAQPIFAEGDIIGCVAAVTGEDTFAARTDSVALETEVKLIRTAAAFLGRQLES